jgi:predicted nuclease of predicted toxin-antitoxin system
VLKKQKHCGIIRLVNISAIRQTKISAYVLEKYTKELQGKAIITVDSERVRIKL